MWTLMDFFFFFQAEDGIRDLYVTGVQRVLFRSHGHGVEPAAQRRGQGDEPVVQRRPAQERSEERRVGKECRAWWLPDRLKKQDGSIRLEVPDKAATPAITPEQAMSTYK